MKSDGETEMRIGAVFTALLVGAILLTDLAASFVFAFDGAESAALVRRARELFLIITACCGAFAMVRSKRFGLSDFFGAAYAATVIAYLAAFWLVDFGDEGATPSAGVLLLPIIFVLCGHALAAVGAWRIDLVRVVVIYAAASALFGLWEIQATEFWTETARLPDYLRSVKGIDLGFEPLSGLPWNFFRTFDERRAAGLLAAPLAQGPVLMIAAALCLIEAWRWRWFSAVLGALLMYGAIQSGTRAAPLTFLLFVLLVAAVETKRRISAMTAVVLLWVGAIFFFKDKIEDAVALADGSTIGHLQGLESSLADLPSVFLTGAGLGAQGVIAGQEGRILIGGGESGFFSIAFQIGLPGAFTFALFYGALLIEIWRGAHKTPEVRNMALLGLAMAANLFISDYLFTISGAGVLWLLLGFYQAQGRSEVAEQEAL